MPHPIRTPSLDARPRDAQARGRVAEGWDTGLGERAGYGSGAGVLWVEFAVEGGVAGGGDEGGEAPVGGEVAV